MATLKYRQGAGWVILGGIGPTGPQGQGVPAGGAQQGYYLAKKSATDYDTEWFNPPHVRVIKTVQATLTAATFTPVAWDTAPTYDSTGTMWAPGTSTSKLFAPRTGYYTMRTQWGATYKASDRLATRILNDAGGTLVEAAHPVAVSTCCGFVETMALVTAGQGCSVSWYSQLGTTTITAAGYCFFEMRWVAPQ